ncbi:PqqD family protein [candidate division KSB1 bacterium]|nr:MAG: PqqD family protein [candidate division KSB1 bacterium]
MKKTNSKTQNVIEMIPKHNIRFETREDIVVILTPKFKNKFIVKYIMSRMKQPNYSIHLDAYGSAVWNLMNGEKTVYAIGKELKAEFGESVEPVYERLGLFMNMLAQRKFITLSSVVMRTEREIF